MWKVKDRVRLVRDVEGVPAGSEGVVFGFLRRPEGDQLAVAFTGTKSLILDLDAVEPVPLDPRSDARP